ncbi:MAG: lipopolysaccharide biosynthesis protein [Actinobacteria bacterium]|nr:lipopolysaccharide biosynthesis protein [Actinomycetota bacterium]
MNDLNRHGLAQATFSALKWGYVGTAVKVVAQMLIGVVLARLLGPEPFGLVAVSWIVIGLGGLVSDFGFGAALVQRKTISEVEIRYVFTIQVLIGIGLTLIIAIAATQIAQVFNQQQIIPVMRALSLIFFIQAFSQTAVSLLRRNLDLKGIQLAQVMSYILSYIMLGIPLAYFGFGVWSLILAQLSQSLLYTAFTYLRARHPVKPLFRTSIGLFNFGSKVMGANIFNWSIQNMDNAFVGKFFGVASLGLYSRTYTLMIVPLNNVVTVLQGVLFPAYSKAQEETEMLKRVYLASVGVIAMIVLPLFGSVAAIPHTVIEGLYGEKWLGAVPILVPIALAMPFHAIMSLAGPLIWGKGKVGKELVVQAITAALFISVLLVTSKISLVTLAWGVFGVYVVRFFLMTRAVLRLVDASWPKMLMALRGGVLILAGTTLAARGMDSAILSYSIASPIRLFGDVSAAGVALCLMFLLFPRYLITEEIAWLFGRFSHKIPRIFRSFLSRIRLVET